jgi:hypothetical protein
VPPSEDIDIRINRPNSSYTVWRPLLRRTVFLIASRIASFSSSHSSSESQFLEAGIVTSNHQLPTHQPTNTKPNQLQQSSLTPHKIPTNHLSPRHSSSIYGRPDTAPKRQSALKRHRKKKIINPILGARIPRTNHASATPPKRSGHGPTSAMRDAIQVAVIAEYFLSALSSGKG